MQWCDDLAASVAKESAGNVARIEERAGGSREETQRATGGTVHISRRGTIRITPPGGEGYP